VNQSTKSDDDQAIKKPKAPAAIPFRRHQNTEYNFISYLHWQRAK
jgi:hypothetical protein